MLVLFLILPYLLLSGIYLVLFRMAGRANPLFQSPAWWSLGLSAVSSFSFVLWRHWEFWSMGPTVASLSLAFDPIVAVVIAAGSSLALFVLFTAARTLWILIRGPRTEPGKPTI